MPLLEMRDLGPPSSLPGGRPPLYLSTWLSWWEKPPDSEGAAGVGTQRGFARVKGPHAKGFGDYTVGQNLGGCQAHASLQDGDICPQEHPGGRYGGWSKQGWTPLGVGVGLSSCLLAESVNSTLSQPRSILPALLWSDL